MYQKERIQIITEILKQNGFVTVKFLTEELDYSTATINRDLNAMEKQNIIRRIYGGAELVEEKNVPLFFRYSKMRPIKNKIGKKAAEFICDGDTVFIDCSTTAQYLGKHITERKDLTVITNNLSLASFLSEYNITSICLGGRIMEPPSMVYSAETVENVKKYSADKMFFSAGGITEDGKIGCGEYEVHYLMIKAMMENSDERFLLFDHEKIKPSCEQYIGTFGDVDKIITDFSFSEELKKRYCDTEFIEIT
ncbi:MAG: DeoR/GlpR transcriptional regulator [Clostridia bacterium]|nr:DeoR/GlpR transcriptional regulator [Clostridia bacterium]